MDFTDTINILNGLVSENTAQIQSLTTQNENYTQIITAINNLTVAPAQALIAAQTALANEQAAHQSDNSANSSAIATLNTQISTMQQSILTLEAQVTSLGGTPPPIVNASPT